MAALKPGIVPPFLTFYKLGRMCVPMRPLWTDLLPGRKKEMVRKGQGWGKMGRCPATELPFISKVSKWLSDCCAPHPRLKSLRHEFEQIFHDLTASLRYTASSAHKIHSCVPPLLWQQFMSMNVLLLICTELPLQMPKPCSAQSWDCVVPRHSLLLAVFSSHLMEALREPLGEKQ